MSAKDLKANLTSGNIARQLLSLSIPMSFGVFSIIGFNLIDTYFVGMLGSLELAAMAYTFPIPMIVGAFSFGIGTSTSSFTSRAVGAGNVLKVKRYTSHSLLLALLVVIFFAIFGYNTIDWQFRSMGANDDVMPLIREYMEIWYLSTPFIVIPMVGNNIIRSLGDTKNPAKIMAVAGIVNVVLDPILIFGFGPITGMGLKGAAIATAIARFFTLISSLFILHRKYGVLENPFKSYLNLLDTWKKILWLAIPATLTNLVAPITIGLVTKMVSGYSNKIVAGFGVGTRIEAFLTILLIGLSTSLAPFVGQNLGAKKIDRIKIALKYANFFPIVWSILCFVFIYFFSDYICRIFNDDPEVIKASRDYLLIITIGMIGSGVLLNAINFFNALGKPKLSLIANVFKMFILYIPYAFILKMNYQEKGIYFAGLIAHVVSGLAVYYYLKLTLKKMTST